MNSSLVEEKIEIGGILADNVTMSQAVGRIENLIQKDVPSYVVTPNVDHVVRFQNDREFKQVYAQAALVLPDGMPLIWAGQILGSPFKEKVSGSDLVPALCPFVVKMDYKIFLLGGRPGAAEKAGKNLEDRFPGLRIAGTYSPPYGFENDIKENARIIDKIKKASPDILLVGLGSPKQEKWAYRYYQELQVPVTVGVGITFEFIAGLVKRAPLFMQQAGFEWLWRIIQEPTRLWKRYLIDDPRFFWIILKQKFKIQGTII